MTRVRFRNCHDFIPRDTNDIIIPNVMRLPSIIMRLPRRVAGEHSAWYVGTVEVCSLAQHRQSDSGGCWRHTFSPLPKPVTMRATTIWAYPYDVVWSIAPIIMMIPPNIIVCLRPSLSPIHRFERAPIRHPISYHHREPGMWETIGRVKYYIDSNDKAL
jgi:hypothetical protein